MLVESNMISTLCLLQSYLWEQCWTQEINSIRKIHHFDNNFDIWSQKASKYSSHENSDSHCVLITEKSLPINIIGGHLSWQLRLVPTSIRISCQCRGFFSPVDFFQVLTSRCVFHALVSFKFYRREGGGWVRRRIRHAIRLKWEEGLFGKKVAAASVLINWDIVSGLCLLCFWDFLRSAYQNVVCFSL